MQHQASFWAKTCCLHTWKDHGCYGFIINRVKCLVFHWCLYKVVWEREHLRLEIQNFSSRVEKYLFQSFASSLVKYLNEKFYAPMRLVIIAIVIMIIIKIIIIIIIIIIIVMITITMTMTMTIVMMIMIIRSNIIIITQRTFSASFAKEFLLPILILGHERVKMNRQIRNETKVDMLSDERKEIWNQKGKRMTTESVT